MSLIVHINGWPGCGKLTIARVLTKMLDGRLVDNHTLLNPAECLFDRGDPGHGKLRKAVRFLVFEHMVELPTNKALVFTDALADGDWDRAMFEDCRRLAAKRGARLVSAVLSCDADENRRRLVSPARAELHKLVRIDVLDELRAKYRLLRPDGIALIELDVTALSAEAAAAALYEFCARQ